jgi:hypothetical protein
MRFVAVLREGDVAIRMSGLIALKVSAGLR